MHYIYTSIETYLGVIVRLVYSLFSIRWPLAKVFPGLQTIRRDFVRPVCTLLGTFLMHLFASSLNVDTPRFLDRERSKYLLESGEYSQI